MNFIRMPNNTNHVPITERPEDGTTIIRPCLNEYGFLEYRPEAEADRLEQRYREETKAAMAFQAMALREISKAR